MQRIFPVGETQRQKSGKREGDGALHDVYYYVRIRRRDRHNLHFRLAGRFFQALARNCGLSPASRLFTKVLRPVIQELRSRGHRLISYRDDITGAPRASNQDLPATPEDATQAGIETCSLFKDFGITLHPKKSDISGKWALELRQHLRTLLNCAGAARPSRRVVLCH
jgi:hypothetical protein